MRCQIVKQYNNSTGEYEIVSVSNELGAKSTLFHNLLEENEGDEDLAIQKWALSYTDEFIQFNNNSTAEPSIDKLNEFINANKIIDSSKLKEKQEEQSPIKDDTLPIEYHYQDSNGEEVASTLFVPNFTTRKNKLIEQKHDLETVLINFKIQFSKNSNDEFYKNMVFTYEKLIRDIDKMIPLLSKSEEEVAKFKKYLSTNKTQDIGVKLTYVNGGYLVRNPKNENGTTAKKSIFEGVGSAKEFNTKYKLAYYKNKELRVVGKQTNGTTQKFSTIDVYRDNSPGLMTKDVTGAVRFVPLFENYVSNRNEDVDKKFLEAQAKLIHEVAKAYLGLGTNSSFVDSLLMSGKYDNPNTFLRKYLWNFHDIAELKNFDEEADFKNFVSELLNTNTKLVYLNHPYYQNKTMYFVNKDEKKIYFLNFVSGDQMQSERLSERHRKTISDIFALTSQAWKIEAVDTNKDSKEIFDKLFSNIRFKLRLGLENISSPVMVSNNVILQDKKYEEFVNEVKPFTMFHSAFNIGSEAKPIMTMFSNPFITFELEEEVFSGANESVNNVKELRERNKVLVISDDGTHYFNPENNNKYQRISILAKNGDFYNTFNEKPRLAGKLIHSIFAKHFSKGISNEASLKHLLEFENYYKQLSQLVSNSDTSDYVNEIVSDITTLLDTYIADLFKTKGFNVVETELTVKSESNLRAGTIDLILKGPLENQIILIDIKTSNYLDAFTKNKEYFNKQLNLYAETIAEDAHIPISLIEKHVLMITINTDMQYNRTGVELYEVYETEETNNNTQYNIEEIKDEFEEEDEFGLLSLSPERLLLKENNLAELQGIHSEEVFIFYDTEKDENGIEVKIPNYTNNTNNKVDFMKKIYIDISKIMSSEKKNIYDAITTYIINLKAEISKIKETQRNVLAQKKELLMLLSLEENKDNEEIKDRLNELESEQNKLERNNRIKISSIYQLSYTADKNFKIGKNPNMIKELKSLFIKDGITITERAYLKKVVNRFHFIDNNTSKEEKDEEDLTEFANLEQQQDIAFSKTAYTSNRSQKISRKLKNLILTTELGNNDELGSPKYINDEVKFFNEIKDLCINALVNNIQGKDQFNVIIELLNNKTKTTGLIKYKNFANKLQANQNSKYEIVKAFRLVYNDYYRVSLSNKQSKVIKMDKMLKSVHTLMSRFKTSTLFTNDPETKTLAFNKSQFGLFYKLKEEFGKIDMNNNNDRNKVDLDKIKEYRSILEQIKDNYISGVYDGDASINYFDVSIISKTMTGDQKSHHYYDLLIMLRSFEILGMNKEESANVVANLIARYQELTGVNSIADFKTQILDKMYNGLNKELANVTPDQFATFAYKAANKSMFNHLSNLSPLYVEQSDTKKTTVYIDGQSYYVYTTPSYHKQLINSIKAHKEIIIEYANAKDKKSKDELLNKIEYDELRQALLSEFRYKAIIFAAENNVNINPLLHYTEDNETIETTKLSDKQYHEMTLQLFFNNFDSLTQKDQFAFDIPTTGSLQAFLTLKTDKAFFDEKVRYTADSNSNINVVTSGTQLTDSIQSEIDRIIKVQNDFIDTKDKDTLIPHYNYIQNQQGDNIVGFGAYFYTFAFLNEHPQMQPFLRNGVLDMSSKAIPNNVNKNDYVVNIIKNLVIQQYKNETDELMSYFNKIGVLQNGSFSGVKFNFTNQFAKEAFNNNNEFLYTDNSDLTKPGQLTQFENITDNVTSAQFAYALIFNFVVNNNVKNNFFYSLLGDPAITADVVLTNDGKIDVKKSLISTKANVLKRSQRFVTPGNATYNTRTETIAGAVVPKKSLNCLILNSNKKSLRDTNIKEYNDKIQYKAVEIITSYVSNLTGVPYANIFNIINNEYFTAEEISQLVPAKKEDIGAYTFLLLDKIREKLNGVTVLFPEEQTQLIGLVNTKLSVFVDAYAKINVDDGAGYLRLDETVSILVENGNITIAQGKFIEAVLNNKASDGWDDYIKILQGRHKDVSSEAIKQAIIDVETENKNYNYASNLIETLYIGINPLKRVMTGNKHYKKFAEYALCHLFHQNTDLGNLLNQMEENNAELAFIASAVKLKTPKIHYAEFNGTTIKMNSNFKLLKIDYETIFNQQETQGERKYKIAMSSQKDAAIFQNFDLWKDQLFDVNGISMSGQNILDAYIDSYRNLVYTNIKKYAIDHNLKQDDQGQYKFDNPSHFVEYINDLLNNSEMEDMIPDTVIQSLKLNNENQLKKLEEEYYLELDKHQVFKKENPTLDQEYQNLVLETQEKFEARKQKIGSQSKFNSSPFLSDGFEKLESVIISQIEKKVLKVKLPGVATVITPESHITQTVKLTEANTKVLSSGLIIWADPNRTSTQLEDDEILVPFAFTCSVTGKKLLIENFLTTDSNGRRFLDVNRVPQEILKAIGYRIPLQALPSMKALRIAGFLPTSFGSHAIGSKNLVAQIGLDFDIDKLQILLKSIKTMTEEQYNEIQSKKELIEIDYENGSYTFNNQPIEKGHLAAFKEILEYQKYKKIQKSSLIQLYSGHKETLKNGNKKDKELAQSQLDSISRMSQDSLNYIQEYERLHAIYKSSEEKIKKNRTLLIQKYGKLDTKQFEQADVLSLVDENTFIKGNSTVHTNAMFDLQYALLASEIFKSMISNPNNYGDTVSMANIFGELNDNQITNMTGYLRSYKDKKESQTADIGIAIASDFAQGVTKFQMAKATLREKFNIKFLKSNTQVKSIEDLQQILKDSLDNNPDRIITSLSAIFASDNVTFVSETINQLGNVAVDNAKMLAGGRLNLNVTTFPIACTLAMLGLNLNEIYVVLNSPLSKEFLDLYVRNNNIDSFRSIENSIDTLVNSITNTELKQKAVILFAKKEKSEDQEEETEVKDNTKTHLDIPFLLEKSLENKLSIDSESDLNTIEMLRSLIGLSRQIYSTMKKVNNNSDKMPRTSILLNTYIKEYEALDSTEHDLFKFEQSIGNTTSPLKEWSSNGDSVYQVNNEVYSLVKSLLQSTHNGESLSPFLNDLIEGYFNAKYIRKFTNQSYLFRNDQNIKNFSQGFLNYVLNIADLSYRNERYSELISGTDETKGEKTIQSQYQSLIETEKEIVDNSELLKMFTFTPEFTGEYNVEFNHNSKYTDENIRRMVREGLLHNNEKYREFIYSLCEYFVINGQKYTRTWNNFTPYIPRAINHTFSNGKFDSLLDITLDNISEFEKNIDSFIMLYLIQNPSFAESTYWKGEWNLGVIPLTDLDWIYKRFVQGKYIPPVIQLKKDYLKNTYIYDSNNEQFLLVPEGFNAFSTSSLRVYDKSTLVQVLYDNDKTLERIGSINTFIDSIASEISLVDDSQHKVINREFAKKLKSYNLSKYVIQYKGKIVSVFGNMITLPSNLNKKNNDFDYSIMTMLFKLLINEYEKNAVKNDIIVDKINDLYEKYEVKEKYEKEKLSSISAAFRNVNLNANEDVSDSSFDKVKALSNSLSDESFFQFNEFSLVINDDSLIELINEIEITQDEGDNLTINKDLQQYFQTKKLNPSLVDNEYYKKGIELINKLLNYDYSDAEEQTTMTLTPKNTVQLSAKKSIKKITLLDKIDRLSTGINYFNELFSVISPIFSPMIDGTILNSPYNTVSITENQIKVIESNTEGKVDPKNLRELYLYLMKNMPIPPFMDQDSRTKINLTSEDLKILNEYFIQNPNLVRIALEDNVFENLLTTNTTSLTTTQKKKIAELSLKLDALSYLYLLKGIDSLGGKNWTNHMELLNEQGLKLLMSKNNNSKQHIVLNLLSDDTPLCTNEKIQEDAYVFISNADDNGELRTFNEVLKQMIDTYKDSKYKSVYFNFEVFDNVFFKDVTLSPEDIIVKFVIALDVDIFKLKLSERMIQKLQKNDEYLYYLQMKKERFQFMKNEIKLTSGEQYKTNTHVNIITSC